MFRNQSGDVTVYVMVLQRQLSIGGLYIVGKKNLTKYSKGA
jgi:hypothetical protein